MTIKANDVQDLRMKTGAGMMECKKALEEAGGDIEKAVQVLREKGIAKAAKRADREVKEGQIISYIHPGGKLGVLLEINCETDFVARTDEFNALAKDFAMQVAAASPLCLSREQVPEELLNKEKEIIAKQLEGSGKPANVIEKIIPGKLDKFYSEICLMEQPFVKEPGKTMKDILTDYIAKIGENIAIKRFTRYQLGENE